MSFLLSLSLSLSLSIYLSISNLLACFSSTDWHHNEVRFFRFPCSVAKTTSIYRCPSHCCSIRSCEHPSWCRLQSPTNHKSSLQPTPSPTSTDSTTVAAALRKGAEEEEEVNTFLVPRTFFVRYNRCTISSTTFVNGLSFVSVAFVYLVNSP